jgi:hypothetical protein
MRDKELNRHLRLVPFGTSANPPKPPPPPAASHVTIEISDAGALSKLEVELRPQDALQAMNGLAMALMRAIDALTA